MPEQAQSRFSPAAAAIIAALITGTATILVGYHHTSELSDDAAALREQVKKLTAENNRLAAENRALLQQSKNANGTQPDPSAPKPAPADDPYAGQVFGKQQKDGFSISLYRCRREGSDIKCYITVENTDVERQFVLIAEPQYYVETRGFDERGGELSAVNAQIGEVVSSQAHITIPAGAALRASLTFPGRPNITQFSILQIAFIGRDGYKVEFRGVPIGT